MFEKGARAYEVQALADRRKTVLDKLQQFGGFKKLIEGEEKYPTYLSENVYNLFCTKYKELLVAVEK